MIFELIWLQYKNENKNISSFVSYLCVAVVALKPFLTSTAGFIMHSRILRLNNKTMYACSQQI